MTGRERSEEAVGGDQEGKRLNKGDTKSRSRFGY